MDSDGGKFRNSYVDNDENTDRTWKWMDSLTATTRVETEDDGIVLMMSTNDRNNDETQI